MTMPFTPALVYVLCSATSVLCLALLVRRYLRTRTRLLLWSALCFVGLALANLLLFLDLVVFTQTDLTVFRSLSSFAAVAVLLFGFIWEID
jgi:heme/copper-type cytochrome/quinol oxidase subunit 4